jgi:hypothetical protein
VPEPGIVPLKIKNRKRQAALKSEEVSKDERKYAFSKIMDIRSPKD